MGRSAASIQAEITTLETHLQSSSSLINSTGADGVSLSYSQRSAIEARIDKLYMQLGRANGSSPMIVRGVVRGLNGSNSL